MHSHGVAHRSVFPHIHDVDSNATLLNRDCSLKNILMDATHMFPLGFHPVKNLFLFDFSAPAPIISRRRAGVKYYFIDYGISSYFPAEEPLPHRVVGLAGRDQDVPELSDKIPYDPFKVDIFTVGNVLLQELCHVRFSQSHPTQTSPNFMPRNIQIYTSFAP
jgi:serine/threonine protein kinase